MKEDKVILTPIFQADGAVKNSPAIILKIMPSFNDCLVCGVSTQLHHEVKGFDSLILSSDEDFVSSGLKSDSLIRLGFLAVIPQKNIIGSIGSISSKRHKQLIKTYATISP